LLRVERSPFFDGKAAFAYVDDDGATEVLTVLKPMFDQFGAKFTMAIVTDWIGTSGFLTKEQLASLYAEGHDVISHTKSHSNLSLIDEQEIDYQLSKSKEFLNIWGYPAEHLAYPHGSNSATEQAIKIVKKYYKSAMYGRNNRNIKPMHSYRIKRIDIAWSTHTLEDYKALVDEAIENKELFVLLGHISALSPERVQMLEDVIQYIYSLGFKVERYHDAYEKHSNSLEIGDHSTANPLSSIAIGADGKVSMSGAELTDKRIITAGASEFTNTNVISDFKKDAITINVVKGAQAGGLPTGRGGTLFTYNLSDDPIFAYQEYKPFEGNILYRRRWTATNVWSAWENPNPYVQAEANLYLNASPVQDFELGKITVNVVKGAFAEGFPNNKGGVLTTYRLDIDPVFSYQEYKCVGNSTMYRRYWNSNGYWSVWSPAV